MRCPHEVVITSDTLSENWNVAVWDPCSGSQLSSYKQASSLGNKTLQLISDSYLIAADSTKPRLHIWSLNSQTPVTNLRLFTPGKVSALACTPNGLYLAAAIGEKIYLWQTCNGKLLASFARHYQVINCLMFNKDGSCFASGSEDGLIFVWSLCQVTNDKDAKPLSSFSHHSLPVKDLYFSQIGSFGRLCSVSLDRSARIYDIYEGTLLLTLIFDEPLTSVCMDILENEIFVGTSTGVILKSNLRDPPRSLESHVMMIEDNKTSIFKGHQSSIVTLDVSVDCITLLSGSIDGTVHLWDIPSRQVIRTLQHKAAITSAFFAKAYDNFSNNNYKASLVIRSLQKVSEDGERENILEVLNRERDDSWLIDVDSFIVENSNTENTTDCKNKLLKACNEIERLKNINAQLYQYSVKHIFQQNLNNSNSSNSHVNGSQDGKIDNT